MSGAAQDEGELKPGEAAVPITAPIQASPATNDADVPDPDEDDLDDLDGTSTRSTNETYLKY
jgi:hypothetical protein